MLLTLTLDFIEYLGKPPFNIKRYLEREYGVYFSLTTIKKIMPPEAPSPSGAPDMLIGTTPSSAAFNNTVLSDVNWLNWRIVSESSGIAWRLRFEIKLTSSRAT